MNRYLRHLAFSVPFALCAVGCTQSFHGSFTPSTYAEGHEAAELRELGPVEGRSCQTRALYVLPQGERASTDQALRHASARIEGTEILVNVSIDDEAYFGIGYSKRCIVVRATALGFLEATSE